MEYIELTLERWPTRDMFSILWDLLRYQVRAKREEGLRPIRPFRISIARVKDGWTIGLDVKFRMDYALKSAWDEVKALRECV